MLDRLALLDQINRELPANVDWKAGAQRFVASCFDKMGRDTVEKKSMNKPFGVVGEGDPTPAIMECVHYLNNFTNALSLLKPHLGARVLDVACGGGWVSHFLSKMGYWTYGIDISSDFIDLARLRLSRDPTLHIAQEDAVSRFSVLDIETTHLPDHLRGTFDIVWLESCLHHFFDPVSALENLADALKSDGIIVLLEFENRQGPIKDEYMKVTREFDTIERPYARAELENALQLVGLSEYEFLGTMNGWFSPHDAIVSRMHEVIIHGAGQMNLALCAKQKGRLDGMFPHRRSEEVIAVVPAVVEAQNPEPAQEALNVRLGGSSGKVKATLQAGAESENSERAQGSLQVRSTGVAEQLRAVGSAIAEFDNWRHQVGQLNPRKPGIHNRLIQFFKQALRRLLSWYTRPLNHADEALSRALWKLHSGVASIAQAGEEGASSLTQLDKLEDRLEERVQSLRREFYSTLESKIREARVDALRSAESYDGVKAALRSSRTGNGGRMDSIQLQQRIDQIQWYHDIDFPNGLKARTKNPDAESHRKLWDWMRSELAKIDFANRTVLDIGCWDGYWSFYAEQRGASRVLATDDKTQNWSGNSGLELARELMGSSVETRTDVSIYEAAKLGDRFDIVLCLGVYYHLVDPFYAFSQVRHCSNSRSVVIFEGDFGPDCWLPQQAAFLDLGDPGRCFVPSVPFLRQMLEANYFHILTESIYHGLPDQPVNRIFVTCEPFEGENALHCTRPPFGLHSYDPRFSAN
jgi:tRNA (mo5U34)-methyltransferase